MTELTFEGLLREIRRLGERVRQLEAGGGGGGVSDHGALTGLSDDDHTQYHNTARGDARYALLAAGVTNGDAHNHVGGDGGQVDHGGLAGLADDDHSQYHNNARGDARYVLLADGVTNGDAHDHSGGDGGQISHTGLSNLNTTTYTHITAANHTDLTDGGATTLHKHAGLFVPVTPTTLVDSLGNTWSAAARNTGTYTFRPADNSNLWPTDASGVLLLLFGSWSTASSGSAVTLRQTSGGANVVQIKALVAASGYNLQGITPLDGSGYFYVLVEGANASAATVRILGYFL